MWAEWLRTQLRSRTGHASVDYCPAQPPVYEQSILLHMKAWKNLSHFPNNLEVKIPCACDLFLLSLATSEVNQFLPCMRRWCESMCSWQETQHHPGIHWRIQAREVIARWHWWTDSLQGLHIWVVLLPKIRHVLWWATAQNYNVEKQSVLCTMASNAEMSEQGADCVCVRLWVCVCTGRVCNITCSCFWIAASSLLSTNFPWAVEV